MPKIDDVDERNFESGATNRAHKSNDTYSFLMKWLHDGMVHEMRGFSYLWSINKVQVSLNLNNNSNNNNFNNDDNNDSSLFWKTWRHWVLAEKKYHYHYRIHKDAKQVFRQMENNSLMINRFYGQSVWSFVPNPPMQWNTMSSPWVHCANR